MKVIDKNLMDGITEQAKELPRLRMNFNFHAGMEDLCHRMLNALEPGTVIPIHRHATKDKTIVLLRYTVHQIFVNYFHIANMLGKHKIIIHISLQPVTALVKNVSTTQLLAPPLAPAVSIHDEKHSRRFLKCPVNIARIPLNPCIGTEKSVVPA